MECEPSCVNTTTPTVSPMPSRYGNRSHEHNKDTSVNNPRVDMQCKPSAWQCQRVELTAANRYSLVRHAEQSLIRQAVQSSKQVCTEVGHTKVRQGT